MSRGLGRVQKACLRVISEWKAKDDWPTTFDIAAEVYQIKPDKDGVRYVSEAQHVAVKRALEGLQGLGLIIGARIHRARIPGDDLRTELAHHWMSINGARKYLKDLHEAVADAARLGGRPEYFMQRIARFKAKAKAIGMQLEKRTQR
jgi:hypothetical protein